MLDVVIVGGGPAGLNAALMLGRCRRSVLVCDAGQPRNARSRWVSGFLTRDGTDPHDLRQMARDELSRYPTVQVRDVEVSEASQRDGGFETVIDGERVRSRKLILAPGLMNDVPDFPGSREFFGRGVYPCPYCDGWEHRDQPLAAYGRGEAARGMALELLTWTNDVILVTNGPGEIPDEHRRELASHNIPICEEPMDRLEGDPEGDGLEAIRLQSGRVLERRGLFYSFEGCRPTPLVERLGLDLGYKGSVETDELEKTAIPGLFVAGDASRRVKFAVVAAAEGAMAAFAINTELLKEDLHSRDNADRAER